MYSPSFIFIQALKDTKQHAVVIEGAKDNGLDDSEDEGEELLKQVRDRKQSLAKLQISPQEKDLLQILSSGGGGEGRYFI